MRALEYGFDQLDNNNDFLVRNRLFKKMHEILMSGGVRGEIKSPGRFRDCQNFIGRDHDIAKARYVPPPKDEVESTMRDLERYINLGNDLPSLVRIALIHYQFEAIHAFEDGNGRLGRLLISLLLASYSLLSHPILSLSAFFERHRKQYNAHIWQISREGAWQPWIAFFLNGVVTEAVDASRRAKRLLDLREMTRGQMQSRGSSTSVLALVDSLFEHPVVNVSVAMKILKLSYRSALKNIEKLEQAGFLGEITGKARNRIYVARPIIDILEVDSI